MAPDHNVRHVGPTPAGSEQSTPRAFYDQSWALVIGISAYQDPQARLANARNDAEAVAKLLKETYHFEHVTLLCDAEATHDAILGWLRDQLPAQVGSNDRFVFFFAGHGTSRTGSTGQVRGYLMPQDAELGKYASYIDMEEVRNACGWIGAKHIFLILDCCFSGIAAITTRATLPARPARVTDAYFQRITELPAWQVLTAGASDELVADSGSRPGHSAFTGAVLGGLEGWADDDGDGIITASDLAEYVRQTVSHETASGRTRQFPYFNYLMGSGQGDYVFTRPGRSILPTSPSLPTLGGPSGGGRPLPPRSLRLWGLSAVIILIIVGGMVSRWTNIWGIWDRWPQAEATAAYATAQPTTAAAVGEATSTAAVAALIFPPTPSPAPTLTFPPRPSPVSTLATPIWSQFATAVAGATDEPAPPEPSPTPQPEETSPDDYIAALRAAIPLFTDDFSQESADWVANRFDGMDYAIADGELQIGVEIPNSLGWSILDQRQRDFYLEVDTTYLGDPAIEEHGVLFRYVDPQNFYFFAVSATGRYSLWRLHQNEWQPLEDWTLTDALDLTPGATNRLGLLVEGEQVTLWINDQRVVETGDDTFPAGAVGLAVGTFDEVGARAAFDNVTIWGVEATADSPTASDAAVLPTPEAGDETPPFDGDEAAVYIGEIMAVAPTFDDDFRRDQRNWDVGPYENSEVFFDRRTLHLTINSAEWLGWSEFLGGAEQALWLSDFYTEVDVSFVQRPEGSTAGLVFRLQDADNFYLYAIDADGYYSLQKKVNGEWAELIPWTISDLIDSGENAASRVGVLAEGSDLVLTLNGEVIGEVEDADLGTGSVALMATAGAVAGVEVSFDNFALWDLTSWGLPQ